MEYKVVVVDFRESRNALSPSPMEKAMNEHAKQGWRVIDVTPGEVPYGMGSTRIFGVAITLERG